MILGLRSAIYQRGASGVPSTTLLAPDFTPRATNIQWTITDQGGFESAQIGFVGVVDDFLWWADELGAAIAITTPDAGIAWEGRLVEVAATLGQERHSRSLDGMANRVRCRYTTVNGVPGVTATASDTTSQGRYGIKDRVVSLPTVVTAEAEAFRDRTLDKTRFPVRRPSSQATTGALGGIEISLAFAGWYYSLDDVMTENTTTSTAVVSTQVGTLLTNAAAVNAFVSTSTANITASTVAATQKIDADTTYRAAIESRLAQGTGSARYAWGVYEDRVFSAEAWAGAAPTTIHYYRDLASGQILNAARAIVPPWDVRPNRMYQINDLLDLNPASNEQDSAARFYVARTTFHADAGGVGVSLEPSDSDDLTARLAAYEARGW